MKLTIIIIATVFISNAKCSVGESFENPIVQTRQGSVQGLIIKSRENRDVLAFRGIRYAEAPIGPNRFKPPVPVKSWPGVYDATDDGAICPQPNTKGYTRVSEDCLILNVYTKNLTGNEPVLVYIHGGGFVAGSSHSRENVGPEYFMDKEIVFVSLNYRLGPLGFMSTGNEFASGNFGLKDQVLALKWVRDNIRFFGGNPNLVTISGESAGSMSVSLHLVSPLSRGLFHRAIGASGSVTDHNQINNTEAAKILSEILDCQWVQNSQDTVNCLRNKTYTEIISATSNLRFKENGQLLPWYYQIEENRGNGEFLTENPSILIGRGDFSRVPILVGITKDEFGPLAYGIMANETLLEAFDNNFEAVAPSFLFYERNTQRSRNISRALRKFYLDDSKITMFNIPGFCNLFADAIISHGVHRLVHLARNYTDVYYYRLDFMGRYSHFYDPDGKPHGVTHADDLQYLFYYDFDAPLFTIADPENLMVERLTSWYTTFAKTGQPNDPSNPWISSIHWLPSNSTKITTLYMNKTLTLGDEPYQDRFNLWDRLFPIPTFN